MKKLYTLIVCTLLATTSVAVAQEKNSDVTEEAVACLGKVVPGARISKLSASSPSGAQAVADKLYVKKGDYIEQGGIVASIKGHKRAETSLERAKAALKIVESSSAIKILQQENLIADLEGTFAQNQKILDEKDPPRREREELEYEQESLLRKISQAKAMLPLIKNNESAIVSEAKASVTESQNFYDEHFVRSPISGTVVDTHIKDGEALGMEGICEIADTNKMFIDAEVYVADVSKIKLADKAEVFSDALGKEIFTGKVVEISNSVRSNKMFSTDPGAYSNLRVVLVKIALDDASKFRTLIGSQVNVRILSK